MFPYTLFSENNKFIMLQCLHYHLVVMKQNNEFEIISHFQINITI